MSKNKEDKANKDIKKARKAYQNAQEKLEHQPKPTTQDQQLEPFKLLARLLTLKREKFLRQNPKPAVAILPTGLPQFQGTPVASMQEQKTPETTTEIGRLLPPYSHSSLAFMGLLPIEALIGDQTKPPPQKRRRINPPNVAIPATIPETTTGTAVTINGSPSDFFTNEWRSQVAAPTSSASSWQSTTGSENTDRSR